MKKLGVDCLDGPAGDAEDAFNQYLRAANAWGECAGTAGCAASEIEGKLQRRWRRGLEEPRPRCRSGLSDSEWREVDGQGTRRASPVPREARARAIA